MRAYEYGRKWLQMIVMY